MNTNKPLMRIVFFAGVLLLVIVSLAACKSASTEFTGTLMPYESEYNELLSKIEWYEGMTMHIRNEYFLYDTDFSDERLTGNLMCSLNMDGDKESTGTNWYFGKWWQDCFITDDDGTLLWEGEMTFDVDENGIGKGDGNYTGRGIYEGMTADFKVDGCTFPNDCNKLMIQGTIK